MTGRQIIQLRNILTLAIILTALFSLWTHYSAEPQVNDPAPPPPTDQRSQTEKYINTLTLEEKIAGLLILHTPGTNSNQLAKFMKKHQPAGLILMGDNMPPTLSGLSDLTTSIQKTTPRDYTALIAIDEEGCSVKRLDADTYQCPPSLSSKPPIATKQAFEQRSRLLEDVGINLNFGIVADTTSNPEAFIYPRVFKGSAQEVALRVSSAVKGSTPYTLTTIKHFPGHGATVSDSHNSIPVIHNVDKQQWRKNEALPFVAGINSGADALMFGHLIYADIDKRPASLSPTWHTIAREELDFDGLIVTDDLVMLQQSGQEQYANPAKNALSALEAGATLLLFVTDHGSPESQISISKLVADMSSAVKNGRLPEEVIDRKLEQVLVERKKLDSALRD